MENGTSLPSSATEQHLEPEVLAAFLDGELSEDENREVRRHLAECEECYQVFVDAASFLRQEETTEGTVHPFVETTHSAKPSAIVRHRPWRQSVAMAATVVLAVGTGVFGYQLLYGSDVPLPRWASGSPLPGTRGGEVPQRKQAVIALGARTMDLDVTPRAGRDLILKDVGPLLQSIPELRKSRVVADDPSAVQSFLRSGLREKLRDPQWYDLGRWARAGELAASGQQSDFFSGWSGFKYRHTLSQLLEQADGPEIRELRRIDSLLKAPALDLSQLGAACKTILKVS
jgi:hypothetical protein